MPSPASIRRDQERRAKLREDARAFLEEHSIPFISRNAGAHLILSFPGPDDILDWWPGTELYRSRNGSLDGRGNSRLKELLTRGV